MMLTKQIDIIVSYLKSGPKGMQGKIMDVHLKELLHGSSVVFLSKGIAALAVYLFTYLVSTSYGATAMGSFALSITFLSIAATISKLGLGLSLLKHVSEHAANQNWSIVRGIYTRSVKLVVISGLLLSTFIYVLSPVITKVFYKDASFSSSIRIIALFIIPFSLIELHAESVRGLKNIREYAFLQREMIYLCAVLFLSLSIPFTRWPLTPLMTYLISIVVLSTLGTALWFRLSRITAYSPVYPYSYLSLIKDSIPIFISTASMQMMQWTGILLMGFYRNVSEVGIYNVVSRIAIVTSVILQAINSIAAPRLGELYTLKDMNNFRKMALHTSKLSFWYSFPVLIVIVLFPSQILNLFGDSFTPGVNALLLLSVGQFVNAVCGSVGYLLIMTGHQRTVRNKMLIAMLINILMNITLIPHFGVAGAAIALMISQLYWNISLVISIKSKFDFITIYFPFYRSAQ